jgi:hypothetical protein
MLIIAILVGAGLGLALYYLLATSSDYEWDHKNQKFRNWRKDYEHLEYNRVTHRWEKK